MKRVLTVLLAAFAAHAAPAGAAELRLAVKPPGGVQMGAEHQFTGRLTDNGVPVSGQVVTLEARRFPYAEGFVAIDSARTGDEGQYAFDAVFDRNHEVRAVTDGATSIVRTAFVFPSFKLSFKALDGRRVRLRQRFRTPADARLGVRVFFYVGPRKARRARLRAKVRIREVSKGRYVASTVVKIPRSYGGRFRYASCLPGDRRAGMGDPAKRCGRKFRF